MSKFYCKHMPGSGSFINLDLKCQISYAWKQKFDQNLTLNVKLS